MVFHSQPESENMKTNKLLLLLLFATLTFSCNNQKASESKYPTIADSIVNRTIDQFVPQDNVKQNDIVVVPSRNSLTLKTNQVDKSKMTLADIYKQLDKTPQVFSIPTGKDTILICSESTIIQIKANSFVSEKTGHEITGNIQISIKEYYKLSDILFAKLSTTTNGNILETAGMIHITASSMNENCILKLGQKIKIGFPAKEIKDDMQLYTGDWKNEYQINWKLDSNSFNQNKVFNAVDESANFPGGEQKLIQFLSEQIKYPSRALENGISGTVKIGFVVDENGNVLNPRVMKGIDPECDKAALDAVKRFSKMTPARIKGEDVKMFFVLPVIFDLQDGLSGDGNYKMRFENTYSDSTIQNANSSNISNYLFSSVALGWINCDRLYKFSSPRINYIVNIDEISNSNANIVFHNLKAILSGDPTSHGFSFSQVPAGKSITLVAIKYIDEKPYLAIKETQTSTMKETELDFQPVTMELLKTELKKLDRFN